MAVKCGWASIGETGKGRNNKAGDQTGREVRVGAWYQFGQTAVYRWKDRKLAKAYATAIEALCLNDHIGYDMNDRNTLWNELNAVKWKPAKVKKNVECDCSMLTGCGINCVMGKALIDKSIWTGNIDALLMKTGLFERLTDKKYLNADSRLMTGDIINAPNHHVISALEDGLAVNVKLKAPQPTLKMGDTGERVYALQICLNKLGYIGKDGKKLELDGEFGKNTDYAVKMFQKKQKLEIDGIYGPKTAKALEACL